MDLTGQVALITGASRGLGRAFAEAIAAAGAQAAITSRSADELRETAEQISPANRPVLALPADAIDADGVPRIIQTVEQKLGPITLLINNAGRYRAFGTMDTVDPDEWWQEIEVNLRGPFLYARAIVPAMRARRGGRIINVASGAGLQGMPNASAYGISKTALIRMSETLAQETAADGLKVFAIHPGTVRTPMNAYVFDSPDVAQRAPHIQQWFHTLYAEGRDTPMEESVELVMRIAAGDADTLSGYYLSVGDDIDALVQQKAAQTIPNQRMLRVVQ